MLASCLPRSPRLVILAGDCWHGQFKPSQAQVRTAVVDKPLPGPDDRSAATANALPQRESAWLDSYYISAKLHDHSRFPRASGRHPPSETPVKLLRAEANKKHCFCLIGRGASVVRNFPRNQALCLFQDQVANRPRTNGRAVAPP